MLENLTQQISVSSLGIAEVFDEYPQCAMDRAFARLCFAHKSRHPSHPRTIQELIGKPSFATT
jgi:hypothetical protein